MKRRMVRVEAEWRREEERRAKKAAEEASLATASSRQGRNWIKRKRRNPSIMELKDLKGHSVSLWRGQNRSKLYLFTSHDLRFAFLPPHAALSLPLYCTFQNRVPIHRMVAHPHLFHQTGPSSFDRGNWERRRYSARTDRERFPTARERLGGGKARAAPIDLAKIP